MDIPTNQDIYDVLDSYTNQELHNKYYDTIRKLENEFKKVCSICGNNFHENEKNTYKKDVCPDCMVPIIERVFWETLKKLQQKYPDKFCDLCYLNIKACKCAKRSLLKKIQE